MVDGVDGFEIRQHSDWVEMTASGHRTLSHERSVWAQIGRRSASDDGVIGTGPSQDAAIDKSRPKTVIRRACLPSRKRTFADLALLALVRPIRQFGGDHSRGVMAYILGSDYGPRHSGTDLEFPDGDAALQAYYAKTRIDPASPIKVSWVSGAPIPPEVVPARVRILKGKGPYDWRNVGTPVLVSARFKACVEELDPGRQSPSDECPQTLVLQL
jgi:hypothetical protein